jgi:hypothetical protein
MIRFVVLGTALTLVCLSAGRAEESASGVLEMTAAERALVRDLAERALKERDLFKGKVYLSRIEMFRDTADKTAERKALVTHYRYDGDQALFTSVNLSRKQVTGVEVLPHFPTSLAAEELAEAEKLARGNAEVKRALGRHFPTAEVDALLTYTSDAKSPAYNHRVVRLFFREGRTYLLYGPGVDVDLTTGRVRVERTDKAHN